MYIPIPYLGQKTH